MSKLSTPSQQELLLSRMVHKRVLEELKQRNVDKDKLADLLDLYPSGAGALLAETTWSLETAIRVADALNIDITALTAIHRASAG